MAAVNITEMKGILDLNPSLISMPPELVSKFASLITLLKAAGIIFIVYLVFLIIRSVLGIIRGRKIDKIYNKINEIDGKLDLLMKRFKIYTKVENSSKLDKTTLKTKK
ncbi:MAG: hypothetical protein PHF67_03410 [Candidatus Nanoarchaeia archaeon]|nr:hypothetical protein [Candidatus Nanoarchaeia archaeon]